MKNKAGVRKKVNGTEERPRLAVYRSGRHTYAQIINDENGQTLVSASTVKFGQDKAKSSKEAAMEIGRIIAEKAKAKNIEKVVFDRSGYIYHGRVKSLAEGARDGGLQF